MVGFTIKYTVPVPATRYFLLTSTSICHYYYFKIVPYSTLFVEDIDLMMSEGWLTIERY